MCGCCCQAEATSRSSSQRNADNEVNAVILGHRFGDEMNLMFKNDLEDSRQIDLAQWKERSLPERLKEFFAELIEPLL